MKKIKTPAKINLILEILGKRPDGFHEIRSIMQAVSLYDCLDISIEPTGSEISLSGNCPDIPYDSNNLVFRAVELFLERIGLKNQAIQVFIHKNIPVSAGLAGGSSDAAGTLKGLNELYNNPLCREELHLIASNLGSDVNFCLEGGTCTAVSRGEKITRIQTPELKIVIVKPRRISISAKEAYERYSKLPDKPKKKQFEHMKQAIKEGQDISPLLNNDLEKAILPAYPEIERIKNTLINIGCRNALMSGSGPSVFGIYEGDVDTSCFSDDYEVFKVICTP